MTSQKHRIFFPVLTDLPPDCKDRNSILKLGLYSDRDFDYRHGVQSDLLILISNCPIFFFENGVLKMILRYDTRVVLLNIQKNIKMYSWLRQTCRTRLYFCIGRHCSNLNTPFFVLRCCVNFQPCCVSFHIRTLFFSSLLCVCLLLSNHSTFTTPFLVHDCVTLKPFL